jgi:hypothetical protein
VQYFLLTLPLKKLLPPEGGKRSSQYLKYQEKFKLKKTATTFFLGGGGGGTEKENKKEQKRKKQRRNKVKEQRNRKCKQSQYFRSTRSGKQKNKSVKTNIHNQETAETKNFECWEN